MRNLVLLTFSFLAGFSLSAGAAEHQRIALVMGNAAYKESPLANPVNDARAIGAKLRALDFQVVEVDNGTLKDMQAGLEKFVMGIRPGATALVYYAGHGVQADGRNYLIPVDASLDSELSLRFQALKLNDILDEMGQANSRVNIVILDACRNNPFQASHRGMSRGLAVVDAAAGTLIAYATAPGQVAADGNGNHGLYTGALLKALNQPNLEVEEVFKRVRQTVARETGGHQMPWESSSLVGDFVFNPAANDSTPAPQGGEAAPPEGVVQTDKESLFWESIKDSHNPNDFKQYLAQYPKGTFAAIAKTRALALEHSCADLSGKWLVTYPGSTCADHFTLTRTGTDTYSFHYAVCGGLATVTAINGVGQFKPHNLSVNWTAFPCHGTTVYSFDQSCGVATAQAIKRGGLPVLCQAFVKLDVKGHVTRSTQ